MISGDDPLHTRQRGCMRWGAMLFACSVTQHPKAMNSLANISE